MHRSVPAIAAARLLIDLEWKLDLRQRETRLWCTSHAPDRTVELQYKGSRSEIHGPFVAQHPLARSMARPPRIAHRQLDTRRCRGREDFDSGKHLVRRSRRRAARDTAPLEFGAERAGIAETNLRHAELQRLSVSFDLEARLLDAERRTIVGADRRE